jgi:hypothetical protein
MSFALDWLSAIPNSVSRVQANLVITSIRNNKARAAADKELSCAAEAISLSSALGRGTEYVP